MFFIVTITHMKIIVGMVIVIVGYTLWIQFRPAPPVTNFPSSGTEIVAFGDSLIAGVGASPGNDLVSRLVDQIGEPIANLGVSGNTTSDGVARLDVLDQYDPKVVLVLLGGNDVIQNVPLAETRANLSTIITNIQDRGAVVLLLGVRGGLLADGDVAAMYESLANEHGTAFIPDVLRNVFGRPQLMSDPIHPNDAGYEKISERVAPVLQSVL